MQLAEYTNTPELRARGLSTHRGVATAYRQAREAPKLEEAAYTKRRIGRVDPHFCAEVNRPQRVVEASSRPVEAAGLQFDSFEEASDVRGYGFPELTKMQKAA